MFNPNSNESPFNPLPLAVPAVVLAIALVEFLILAGRQGWVGGPEAIGWRAAFVRDWAFPPGFWPAVFDGFSPSWRDWLRIVGYGFVHWTFTMAALAGVLVLALGKTVAEELGNAAMLVIFFAGLIAGSLAWSGLMVAGQLPTGQPLVGAFPAAFALIGAYTFRMWRILGDEGSPQWQAFRLIGALMAIQILFRVLFGGGPEWVADLAGFGVGYLLAIPFAPGGAARVARARQKIRRR